MNVQKTKYNLDGGSLVEVHKVFGEEYYIAIVELKGEYPESGKEGKDIGREEYVVVLSGELTVWHNNQEGLLKEGDSVTFKNGDTYRLKGEAKCVVFVHDEKNGKTEIIDIKQAA